MRILAISGSLRAASSNTSALKAASILAPPDVAIILYDSIGALPHFNPDLDNDQLPYGVQALRREVGSSDGILICSPEYAHGIAGSLKNALDWLVGSREFPEKPIAVINASPRATHAKAQLLEILSTMNGRVVISASIDLPLMGRNLDASGIAADDELAAILRGSVEEFVRQIRLKPKIST